MFGINLSHTTNDTLDREFIPLAKFNKAFLQSADKPLAIAVERNGGLISVYHTRIHDDPVMNEANQYYVDRIVKFLLWSRGGYRVYICGDCRISDHIRAAYSTGGSREFDKVTMERVYEHDFEVVNLEYEQCPESQEKTKSMGKNFDGCRIGFDAGGSDRKVSAVIDGEAVFSEEVVWHPKTESDPDYHFNGIVAAMKAAAEKMPQVDAIGISSAGIFVDNRTMIASLFLKVPQDLFDLKVKDIYIRAAAEIGDVPVEVANDGDVTALAGAMELNDNNVLGIAMGTSEAAGYVDGKGNITGWLNELAFAPVDASNAAMADEWSGDIGCGVKYFSQDGVIKLAPAAGIALDPALSPGEKLKVVQKHLAEGHEGAAMIYTTIGNYLGHSIALYADFYDIRHILLLGRVMSGRGGELISEKAKEVLNAEYPELSSGIELHLPDEKSRRVGQSVAAASLPVIRTPSSLS